MDSPGQYVATRAVRGQESGVLYVLGIPWEDGARFRILKKLLILKRSEG